MVDKSGKVFCVFVALLDVVEMHSVVMRISLSNDDFGTGCEVRFSIRHHVTNFLFVIFFFFVLEYLRVSTGFEMTLYRFNLVSS